MRKKSNIIILFAVVLFVGACDTVRKAATLATDKPIVILAVNDMHAAIDNFPRLAFMVDSLRAIYPDMLLVSGGDNQTGNPINDQYNPKGLPMIELMNAVGFDLSAVGNHEFDSKREGFSLHTQKARFDFLCANLTPPEGGEFRIKPYKIIALPNGAKAAFVSALHINSGGIPDSHPDNVKGFAFNEPFASAQQYLTLKDSCDVLIFLNHLGFEVDVELANRFPAGAVDLIIGGHSHTRVDKEQIHNGTMITQAENKLKYATLIKLSVKPDGKTERTMQLLAVGKKGSERADVRAMVDKYNDNPALKESIAVAEDDFTSYEQVGYLMADALRAGAQSEIALVNPGGVRIDRLPKGSVSPMNVYAMDPFGNEIILFNLTGNEIRAMLLSAFAIDGQLPIYPSGMRSSYALAPDGSVADVQLFTSEGKPLDMERSYTVAVNSYMASVYKYEHRDPGKGLFRPTAENMIEYLRKLKQIPSYRNEKRTEDGS